VGLSKEDVIKNYDREGQDYDRIRYGRSSGGAFFSEVELSKTLRMMKSGSVLHIGTATGRVSAHLIAKGFDYVGLELSKVMANITNSRINGHGSIICGDAEHLPFKPNTFDNVVSVRSFHFLPHPENFLREAHKILKPTGRIIVSFEKKIHGREIFRKLMRIPASKVERIHYTNSHVASMLRDYGFDILHKGNVTKLPLLVYWNTDRDRLLRKVHNRMPSILGTVGVVVGQTSHCGLSNPFNSSVGCVRDHTTGYSEGYDLLDSVRRILLKHPTFIRVMFPLFNSYRRRWNMASLTESSAMDAILTGVSGAKEFEEKGMADAETLKEFVSPNSTVLDLGCGIGRVDKYLSTYCQRICAVDVSDRMLYLARRRLAGFKNIEFYRNNGHDLSEFGDGTFDFVFALLVFHHLEKNHAKTYLHEIFRVLSNGGTVYAQFPNKPSEQFIKAQAEKRIYDVARTRWYTEEEVSTLLHQLGFIAVATSLQGSQIVGICKRVLV